MTKEALRLAIKALKSIDEAMPFPVAKLAIKECKAALEAPQRTWVGLNWLPEHKCGLHLSHNEHRDVYETVEQFYEADCFVSPEEWHKAVAEDSVWVLHWYPETPIGFHRIAASTLEAVEAKLKEKNQ